MRPDTRTTASTGPTAVAAAATALTCAVAAVGAFLPWPPPERTNTGWQVAEVPATTAGLVAGAVLLCLVLAGTLVRPPSLPGRAAPVVWWLVALASAGALTWYVLYYAALSADVVGAVIPVLDWLLPLVPALVVGLATRRAGMRTHLRATLGTAVVTLPPIALAWALLATSGGVPAFLGSLYSTALLGVVPVVVAVAVTRPRR